jgi:CYTH domain-containing protein
LGFTWEVDKYAGHLEGLFTAEVELPSEDVAAALPAALVAVLDREVTGEPAYVNSNLAKQAPW